MSTYTNDKLQIIADTIKQLKKWGVKYHEIHFGKPSFDLFIDDVTKVFNQIFKLYAAQMQSSLPGFGQEPGSIEEVGLVLPDTRISIYRHVQEPTLGSSGIIADFFFGTVHYFYPIPI